MANSVSHGSLVLCFEDSEAISVSVENNRVINLARDSDLYIVIYLEP